MKIPHVGRSCDKTAQQLPEFLKQGAKTSPVTRLTK